MTSTEALSVLILAGGRSRRMGQDKTRLVLNGQPLIAHVAQRVLPLADEIIFSAPAPQQFAEISAGLGVPVQYVRDDFPNAGPLAGIEAGLRAARNALVLALAADMPFVSLPLLEYMRSLATGYDVVIPVSTHSAPGQPMTASQPMYEPLHAIYRRTCVEAIQRRLSAGDYRVFGFLPDVRVRSVSQTEAEPFDPERLSFFNVNTPDDWRRVAGFPLSAADNL